MDWQAESPELRAFLKSLHIGEIMSGTVTAIERFGVFVDLDEGPGHPTLPGVGFITIPELSWRYFDAPGDVVGIGQRVCCEFLQFDTWNAEARLSLRALEPDPFQAFADRTAVGQELRGTVVKTVPFGCFVDLGDGIAGLVPLREVHGHPAAGSRKDFEAGEEVTVVVTAVERVHRRIFLADPEAWAAGSLLQKGLLRSVAAKAERPESLLVTPDPRR